MTQRKASTHSTAGSRPCDVVVEASECIVKMRSKSILACLRVLADRGELLSSRNVEVWNASKLERSVRDYVHGPR